MPAPTITIPRSIEYQPSGTWRKIAAWKSATTHRIGTSARDACTNRRTRDLANFTGVRSVRSHQEGTRTNPRGRALSEQSYGVDPSSLGY